MVGWKVWIRWFVKGGKGMLFWVGGLGVVDVIFMVVM